jgi:hypothetical protein
MSTEQTLAYPEYLTDELREVLGYPSFKCAPFAQAFRQAGAAIPFKAEEEQAFVLDWLVRLVLTHGANWRQAAGDELKEISEPVRRKSDGANQGERTGPVKPAKKLVVGGFGYEEAAIYPDRITRAPQQRRETVAIYVPDGYKNAEEFLRDCNFEPAR